MRRIFHYIAIAILTLVGPVEAMRSVVGTAGMAHLACQCGCGAPSDAACKCGDRSTSMPSTTSTGPSGSSCSTTNNAPCATQTTSTSTAKAEAKIGDEEQDSEKHPEPKPWPGSPVRRSVAATATHVFVRLHQAAGVRFGRSLDRLASLAMFRI